MQSEQVYLFRVEDYSSASDLGYRDFDVDVSDPNPECSLTEGVTEQCSLTESEGVTEHRSVNIYSPSNRDTEYFRYTYRDGARIRHCHIKGGNINNPLAISRADEVRAACRSGRSCQQIRDLIESFS